MEEQNITIAKSPEEELKLAILQRRDKVINAFEESDLRQSYGGEANTGKIRSRLLSLFLTIHSSMKREIKKDNKEGWIKDKIHSLKSDELNDLLGLFLEIEDFLDKKNVNTFDTITKHDYTNVEEDNVSGGL